MKFNKYISSAISPVVISLILVLGFIHNANAMVDMANLNASAPIVCNPQGGGDLDNMILSFIQNATAWISETNKIAQKIFMLLFFMEFMWQLVVKKVFAGDIEKLWVFFLVRIILGLFFAKYIVNIELYKGVIQYISSIGMNIAKIGFNLNPQQADGLILGPSKIMGYFTCVADSVHKVTDDVGVLQYITLKITLAIMQVLLFVILSLMAYCIILAYIQMYFLLYAGFILTGFSGSSWTMGYWQKYVQTISYVAIKFFVICILMGLLTGTMTEWTNKFAKIIGSDNQLMGLAGLCINILGSAIILGIMIWQIPEWAANSLSSTININLRDRMSSNSKFIS